MSYLGSILSSISNSKPVHHVPLLSAKAFQGRRNAAELPRPEHEAAKLSKAPLKSSTRNGPALNPGIDSTRRESTISSTISARHPTGNPPRNPATEPKAPKKGSYAEIMARGKHTALAKPVGIIKHKPKEKLSSKKEAMLAKELAKLQKKGKHIESKTSKELQQTRYFKSKSEVKSAGKATKSVSYTGTMKSKLQTTYKGTMKPTSISSIRNAYPPDRRIRPPSPDDRSQDSSQDSEEASMSDDYSDMEAGFDDVEEEDERAAREARREDEHEKRMLDELRRQKEARKLNTR